MVTPSLLDLIKSGITQLPAILVAMTGLIIAWTRLSYQISKARHQSQDEHNSTLAEVHRIKEVAEDTKHALNSQLDEWKAAFKATTEAATHAAKLASDAAIVAAHAAGVSQGQGDVAKIKVAVEEEKKS